MVSVFVSQIKFARSMGVTRQTVNRWKREGRIVMIGAAVDPAASRERLSRYASARSKGYKAATADRFESDIAWDVPGPVASLAALAESAAEGVALALLEHMSGPLIEAMVADLLAQWRRSASALADEDFAPPAGHASWATHAAFTSPIALDWDDLRRDASRGPDR